MRYGLIALVGLWLLLVAGCATSFRGSPYIAGGAVGCERRCAESGLDFTALVVIGEYSEACVCQPRGKRASAQQVSRTVVRAVAAVHGAPVAALP